MDIGKVIFTFIAIFIVGLSAGVTLLNIIGNTVGVNY